MTSIQKKSLLFILVLFSIFLLTQVGLIAKEESSINFKWLLSKEKASKQANKKEEWWKEAANLMVETQIVARGVTDDKVIKIMKEIPRHLFVPGFLEKFAYNDGPLPIGEGQTISQPYIVALMTELLNLKGNEKVLEIGTGSGYQAAIISELAKKCYSVELIKSLAESAKERLKELGYKNVYVKWGDGYKGWKEHAPYDAIIVTAAPDEIPDELVKQLKVGGRMVVPIGTHYQELVLITKGNEGVKEEKIIPVRFVPMIKEK